MRIAYLIMAHKNPTQVIRLIDRLDDEGVSFFVHVDRKADQVYRAVTAALADRANCHFVKRRIRCKWGTFDLVRASLANVKALCDSGITCDFAVKLSGQDYPLKSGAAIRQMLGEYAGRQLLQHAALPLESWEDGGWCRIRRYHIYCFDRHITYPPFKLEGPVEAAVARVLSLFLDERRDLPHGYRAYGGSAWWCLTQACVEYVNTFVTTPVGRDLIRFFRYTSNPAEMFIHTVIMNSPFGGTAVNENLRYVDWSANQSNPEILGQADFDGMIASEKLFARKFDLMVDARILDMLDDYIMQTKA